ncbi:hypothetical protein CLM85_23215 [Streptomyces albidoflavus]|nr:hypothetical protein CLM81_06795 [Streptomyces albidoflavus]PAX89683.1 hypothetical protein CLM82_19850 [Streptomyces albidoflavus]PBO16806.1 hypothetical protein CLM83_21730 [Streptomyces albidoflavus]PBO22221.1 hypothetical protein CLM85_23215 [Streptomyces albidoflavus]PBO31767.1 hypothetical protein CLM84_00655 [Streptomyces albidoflavus]
MMACNFGSLFDQSVKSTWSDLGSLISGRLAPSGSAEVLVEAEAFLSPPSAPLMVSDVSLLLPLDPHAVSRRALAAVRAAATKAERLFT